jgi:thymidine phosphorylase
MVNTTAALDGGQVKPVKTYPNSNNNATKLDTAPPLRIPDLIMKKRSGLELDKDEVDFFIRAVCDTNNNMMQESQLGAMLMAIYFKSMSYDEAFHFTQSMMNSGARFDWSKYRNRVVDKHSTGGVGDKVSLPLAPALAACGLKVPMISGRGLGFTGGTLDKLEAIDGFQCNLPKAKIEKLIETVGCCIVSQTLELNPADRILYATRDVTCTVDCAPLIAGSIVSKKAIEDLDALVLDVKIGKAAFMKSSEEATVLADYMIQICRRLGMKAGVFLTRHDNPLGFCIGNQLEIEETIECLHGNLGEDVDLIDLVVKYGGYLLHRSGTCSTMFEGSRMILEKLRNGEALEKFRQMLIGQGVSEHVATELCVNKNYALAFGNVKAKHVSGVRSSEAGFVKSIDALELGLIASKLGAGRSKAGDVISYEVGFRLLKKPGDKIEKSKFKTLD